MTRAEAYLITAALDCLNAEGWPHSCFNPRYAGEFTSAELTDVMGQLVNLCESVLADEDGG